MNDNHERGYAPKPVEPITATQRCLKVAGHALEMLQRLSGSTSKANLEAEAADKGALADQYAEMAGLEADQKVRRVYQWLAGQHAYDELTIRAHLKETRQ